MKKSYFLIIIAFVTGSILLLHYLKKNSAGNNYISYSIYPKKSKIKLYWKDENGNIIKSIEHLKKYTSSKNEELIFACNAGMFDSSNNAVGLFIDNKKIIQKIDTATFGYGNFYLQPNGIFYINENDEAGICTTKEFKFENKKYATQSGPLLLIDGKINPIFKENSSNKNIRNAVGINKHGLVTFVMSKKEVNFYEFANYFKILKCTNALYLDGFVSRTYFPQKNWIQTDGNFGVMIGITE